MKKKVMLLLLCSQMAVGSFQAQEVQGVKLPRLTTAERDLIQKQGDPNNPYASGQVIYNTDTDCMEFWNSTEWVSLCDKATLKLIDPDTLTLGTGTFVGKICFDVVQTTCGGVPAASRTSQKTDFTNRTVQNSASSAPYSGVQTYTFTATSANVSNVRYLIDTIAGHFTAQELIDATTPLSGTLKAGSLANDSSVNLTVHYKSDLNTKLTGKDRNNASKLKIYIIYYDGAKDVKVEIEVRLQDCSCCGAFTAPDVWKAFMCHNLGADYSLDPFTPAAGIHGAKYKWGTGLVVLSPEEDQNPDNDSGFYLAWASMGGPPTPSFVDWDMSTANPCPAGFRVPTMAEWDSVMNNNTWIAVGDWTSSTTNYSSGQKVGTELFLPAAGSRSNNTGSLAGRGFGGCYWSSTVEMSETAMIGYFGEISKYTPNSHIDSGYSVRCIAAD